MFSGFAVGSCWLARNIQSMLDLKGSSEMGTDSSFPLPSHLVPLRYTYVMFWEQCKSFKIGKVKFLTQY